MDDKYYYYADGEKCPKSRYSRESEIEQYGLLSKQTPSGFPLPDDLAPLDPQQARRDPRDIPIKEDDEYYYYLDDSRVKKRDPRELPFSDDEEGCRWADGELVSRQRYQYLQELLERKLGQYGKKNPRDIPIKEDERLYYFEDGSTIKKRDPRDLPFKEDHKYYYYADGEKALKHRYFRNVQFKKERFALPQEKTMRQGLKGNDS